MINIVKELDFGIGKARNVDLYIWKGICKSKNLLKHSVHKYIGNGNITKAWLEPWLPNLEGFTPKLRE